MRREISALAFAALLAGCGQNAASGPYGMEPAAGVARVSAPAPPPLADIPGRLDRNVAAIANPYAGDPRALQRGEQLYNSMNCTYCHGADLGGLIGPSLVDGYWRYGGAPVEIYSSLQQGRPKGMPAWGDVLPPSDLWALTAYIMSKRSGDAEARLQRGHPGSGS